LGTYPDVSLADARSRQADARRLLAAGIDPGEHRKATEVAGFEKAANNSEMVACEWLGKQTLKEGYQVKVVAWMPNDVYTWLGARAIADISAPQFLRVLRRVEERRAVESAHRIMQTCQRRPSSCCASFTP